MFKHNHNQPFSELTPDANGNVPDTTVVGQYYRHGRTHHIFECSRIVFLSDTDEWGYEIFDFEAKMRVAIVVSFKKFHGLMSDGRTKRYTRMARMN